MSLNLLKFVWFLQRDLTRVRHVLVHILFVDHRVRVQEWRGTRLSPGKQVVVVIVVEYRYRVEFYIDTNTTTIYFFQFPL